MSPSSSLPQDAIVVLSTFSDPDIARSCGETLIKEKLAACVSLIPQVESIYEWKGAIERDTEIVAIIKTTQRRYTELETRLTQLHPNEVPEIISLPITSGSLPYLNWLSECVTSSPKSTELL